MTRPKDLIIKWVNYFNEGDTESLSSLYHEDAINHQVANEPIKGGESIKQMFSSEFSAAKMTCIVENLFEDGEWVILEWKDPNGLRGCGFFHIIKGKIKVQRVFSAFMTNSRLLTALSYICRRNL